MNYQSNGIQIDILDDFYFTESSVTFFLKNQEKQKQTNLVIQRQKNTENLAPKEMGELIKSNLQQSGLAPFIKFVKIQEFLFADETMGSLITAKIDDEKELNITIFQAVRIDDDFLTTLTLTADTPFLNSSNRKALLKMLASTQPA